MRIFHSEDELEVFFGRCKLVLVDVAEGGTEVQVSHGLINFDTLFFELLEGDDLRVDDLFARLKTIELKCG